MADSGADFILCQHSHCIGAYEKYNGCEILYGQGDFIFCWSDDEYRHTGLLVRIFIDEDKKEMEFIPVVRHDETVRLADSVEKKEIMESFLERSVKVNDTDFLKRNYHEFAASMINTYYLENLGRVGSLLYRFRLTKFVQKLFGRNNNLWYLNEIRCEAHADIFREGIEGILE
jgi:poly-gamma-glutamate synthesis protein (capsule biosynthesis protein)